MRIVKLSLGALVVAALGCASSGTGATTTPETVRTTTARRTNVIGAQEIESLQSAPSAMDIVRQARPTWLNNPYSVYLDNTPFAGTLSDINAGRIRELQYLSASEAQSRWGSGVRIVILVSTKR